MHSTARTSRQRREPEATVLYRVLQRHLATFLENIALDPNRSLPRFVERELRAFLRCGVLAHFCRVHCAACGKDGLVAFSSSVTIGAPRVLTNPLTSEGVSS